MKVVCCKDLNQKRIVEKRNESLIT